MATKAQLERARQERSKPNRPPSKKKRARREAPGDAPKASVALEGSATKPSRKSTRGGANRVKPDSNLTRRAKRETRAPEARAAAAKAKATSVRGKARGRA